MHISKTINQIIKNKLIEIDLSKQKALDSDLRAVLKTAFQETAGQNLRLYTIL